MPTDLEHILRCHSDALARVLDEAPRHRLQILYTRFDSTEAPRTLSFRADSEYFYPASTIKLPVALAALEFVGELGTAPLTPAAMPPHILAAARGVLCPSSNAPLAIHPTFPDQTLIDSDPTNMPARTLTIGHAIRRIMLVSDNDSHNHLFDLLGHEGANARCANAGLTSTRIHHRLSQPRTLEENLKAPRLDIHTARGTLCLPARVSTLLLPPTTAPGTSIGTSHMQGGTRVDAPMDFAFKNAISLADLHNLILHTCAPELGPRIRGFTVDPDDLLSLRLAMSETPARSVNPRYCASEHPEHATKFLLPGLLRRFARDDLRIENKCGQAYGFTLENAVVRHVSSGRAFALTCVIHTNRSGIVNADDYEYASIALPFFADLGEALAHDALSGQ